MNPYVAAAGIGLQAYGSYQQNDTAEKQYQLAMQAYEAERERQLREEQSQQQQQLLNNVMAGGNYSQGLIKNAQGAYGSYARQVGF